MWWSALLVAALLAVSPARAEDELLGGVGAVGDFEAASVRNCYTCIGNANDRTCEVAPEKVTTGAPYMPCKRKYCTVTRQEYTENPGTIIQITRGCEDGLPHPDGKEVSDEFIIYYWTCNTNLCNTGDGTKAPSGGGNGGGGDQTYVLVEGMAGAAATGATVTVTGLLLLMLHQLQ